MTRRRRLGFFTRILDEAPPPERYRLALEQVRAAESWGFDAAWIAQHHFHGTEGGMPSPFVFLAAAAAQTSSIVLGTSIVTLPLESPLRVAEDAAVLAALAPGRFELGVGSGGTPSSFPPFGHDPKDRPAIFTRHLEQLVTALRGDALTADGGTLYPAASEVLQTLWQATFSADGAAHIGAAGFGLMLSKTQPHTSGSGWSALADTQQPVVDAYLRALPEGVEPRVFGSRGLVVVDDQATADALADRGIARAIPMARAAGVEPPAGATRDELMQLLDIHVGTPDQVVEQFRHDRVLLAATDLVFQSHPVDPPPAVLLRSLELLATEVAPALGWQPATTTEAVHA